MIVESCGQRAVVVVVEGEVVELVVLDGLGSADSEPRSSSAARVAGSIAPVGGRL